MERPTGVEQTSAANHPGSGMTTETADFGVERSETRPKLAEPKAQNRVVKAVTPEEVDERQSSPDSGVCTNDVGKSDDQDSDDEQLVLKRKVNKSRRIVEDDSSDDDSALQINSSSPLAICSNADECGREEDSCMSSKLEEKSNTNFKSRTRKKVDNEITEVEDATQTAGSYKSVLNNSDLFDTEEPADQLSGEPDLPGCANSEDDEHKPEMPAKKSSKQKQSKNEKTVKSIRKQKENLMKIHSDSQRMLRESRVVLPYHQPEHKSLNYFLNRKKNVPSKLKPTLSELRGMLKLDPVKPGHSFFDTVSSTSENSGTLGRVLGQRTEPSFCDIENKHDPCDDDDIDLPPSGIFCKVPEPVLGSQIVNISDSQTLEHETCSESLRIVNLENCSATVVPLKEKNTSESNPYGPSLLFSKDTELISPLETEEKSEVVSIIHPGNASEALRTSEVDRDSETITLSQLESSEAMSSLQMETDSEAVNSQRAADSEVTASQLEGNSEEMGPLQMECDSEVMGPLQIEGDPDEINTMQIKQITDILKKEVNQRNKLLKDGSSTSSNLACVSSPSLCITGANDENSREEAKVTPEDCDTLVLESDKNRSQEGVNGGRTSISTSRLQLLRKPVLEQVKFLTPRLSEGGASSFISLDDEAPVSISPGLQDLMHRFVRHTTPTIKHKAQPQKVELNIVKKEFDDLGKEVLVADTVSVTLNSPTTSSYESPIVQRELLKKVLRAKIAIRREEERQKRIQLCELDNEEGFAEKEGDEGIDEEEAEMTDETETETEDDDEDEESEEEIIVRTKKIRSAFIDDEAEEEEDDDDNNNEDEDENTEDEVDTAKDENGDSGSDNEINEETTDKRSMEAVGPKGNECEAELKANQDEAVCTSKFKRTMTEDLFPQDYSEASFCSSVKSVAKDKSDCINSSMDGSFELMGSEIPPYQPYGGHHPKNRRADPQSDSETELFTPLTGFRPTQTKITQYESQLSLRVGNTQALNGNFVKDGKRVEELEDFDFNFPGSSYITSKFFDDSSASRRELLGKDSQDISDGFDELLGLCSGRFDNSVVPSQPAETTTTKGSLSADSQNNLDELVGLCSGQFTSGVTNITNDSEKEDSLVSLALASDGENSKDENESAFQEDANESCNDEQDEKETDEAGEDSDETSAEDETENVKFTGFGKKGKICREFLEDEAELSGSEMDSDENEDIPEDEDVMEEEEGDRDDILSDDELRDQVGRVHYKTMLDEDKRDLRLFQEVFLQDGDMHSDGRGRERKFRWKDRDGSSGDGFGLNQSDEDSQDDAADQEDLQWRMQRSEREKWLCENNIENQNDELELEGSQLLKFQTSINKRKLSNNSGTPQVSEEPATEVGKLQPTEKFSSPKNIMKTKFRRGSFLSRSKETLIKIAEITKQSSDSNPNGPKHSRNFVFAAKSPAKENVKKICRAASDSATTTQASKRPKYDRTFSADQSRRNSIFSFL